MEDEHFFITKQKDNIKYSINVEVAGGTPEEKVRLLRNIYLETDEDIDWIGLQVEQNYGTFSRKVYGIKKNYEKK